MSNDRATQALARIDAALARIESAPLSAANPAGDPAADARYARLRTAAQAAVGELDALIAGNAR